MFKDILENLSELTDEELQTHKDSLKAQGLKRLEKLDEESPSEEDIAFGEETVKAIEAIDGELSERKGKKERLTSLKDGLSKLSAEAEAEEQEEKADETPAEETSDEDTTEPSDDVEEKSEDDEKPDEQKPVEDANGDDGEDDEIQEKEVDTSVGGLKVKTDVVPSTSTELTTPMVNNATGRPYTGSQEFRSEIAKAMNNVSKGVSGEMLKLGSMKTISDNALELDQTNEFANMQKILRTQHEYMESEEALTAATCCPTVDIIRDFTSYCTTNGLFTLPKVQAPRGSLKYQIPEYACGFEPSLFEWENECDPNVIVDPDREKPCVEVPCGETFEELYVPAFGWCFEYTNETAKFNPEWLEYYFGEARCHYECVKALRLLDLIFTNPKVNATTQTCTAAGLGIIPDLVRILAIKSQVIRRALKNPNLRLEAIVPSWLQGAAFNDAYMRGRDGSLAEVFSRFNITPRYIDVWDRYTGNYNGTAGQPVPPEPADPTGLLDPVDLDACDFPQTTSIILHAPGVFREVDAGDLDFGLIRDSALNAKNKVRIAYEQWSTVGVFGPSCSYLRLDIDGLCARGGVGPRVDPCPTAIAPVANLAVETAAVAE